ARHAVTPRRSSDLHVEVAAVNPRRGAVVLMVVLLSCVLILSAQAPGRGARGATLLQSWILTASAPLTTAIGEVSRGVSGRIGATVDLVTARAENTKLRHELDERDKELFRLRAEVRQQD